MKKSEFLEKLSKGLIIGGAVIAFSSIIAGTATTINGSCKQKKLDKVYEMLQAEKAPIVYQMQEDEIKAISDKFESGEYSFIEATAKLNEVQSDDYVKENNIKIGLIKTDVEGFEQNLLMGAIETIKRDKPVLSISIYHTFDDFFNIKPWIENLNLGYKFKIIKPDVEDICCDVTLIAEVSVQ